MNASDLSTRTIMTAVCCLDGNSDNEELFMEFSAILDKRYGEGALERTAELFTGGHYDLMGMLHAIDHLESSVLLDALRGTR